MPQETCDLLRLLQYLVKLYIIFTKHKHFIGPEGSSEIDANSKPEGSSGRAWDRGRLVAPRAKPSSESFRIESKLWQLHVLGISDRLRARASSRSCCSCRRSLRIRSASSLWLSRLAHSSCCVSFPSIRRRRWSLWSGFFRRGQRVRRLTAHRL